MTDAGVKAYRREVIATTLCPDCGADEGEKCFKIVGPGRGDLQIDYVHDGRSYRHHVDTLFRQEGTENPYVHYRD